MNNVNVFIDTLREKSCAFTGQSFLIAMNQLSNHDHSRFLTRTNHKVGRVDELAARRPRKASPRRSSGRRWP